MKSEPTPSDREVLAGLVERVTYQNAEYGFCVIRIKARGHRELVTVVGHAATISAGEWITAAGDWVNDRTHGQQFSPRGPLGIRNGSLSLWRFPRWLEIFSL
jgi:exodeoxyribonuclease V alpha subunit